MFEMNFYKNDFEVDFFHLSEFFNADLLLAI